ASCRRCHRRDSVTSSAVRLNRRSKIDLKESRSWRQADCLMIRADRARVGSIHLWTAGCSSNCDPETMKHYVICLNSIRTRFEAAPEKSEVGLSSPGPEAKPAPPLLIISRLITP